MNNIENDSFEVVPEVGDSFIWREYKKEYECLVSVYINESDEFKKMNFAKS